MNIQFTGTKEKMTVTLPVGASRRFINGKVEFRPGDIKELDDIDGSKLLELNAKHGYFKKVTKTSEPAKEIAEEDVTKKRGRPRKEE